MSNARTDAFTPAELAAMAQDEQMRPIVIAHVEHYAERVTLETAPAVINSVAVGRDLWATRHDGEVIDVTSWCGAGAL